MGQPLFGYAARAGIATADLAILWRRFAAFRALVGRQPGVDVMRLKAEQFTESTLIDYVRDQLNRQPKPTPESVNSRASMLRRLFQFYFQEEMPHGPYRIQRTWWRRSPLGYGRGRKAIAANLTLKVPQRVIVPLSVEQVRRFCRLRPVTGVEFPHGPRSGAGGIDAVKRAAFARGAGLAAGGFTVRGESVMGTRQRSEGARPATASGNHSHSAVLFAQRAAANQCR